MKSFKKQLSRREFLRLAGLTSVGVLAAACGPAPTPEKVVETVEVEKIVEKVVTATPPPEEVILIEWWHGWPGVTAIDALQAVAELFNEQNETMKVNRLQVGGHTTGTSDVYLTAIAGGAPPDVETGNLPYPEFWARGVLHELDDWIAASTVIDVKDTIPAAIEGGKWLDKTYGWPCVECSLRYGFSYNVALVEAAGLDPDNPPVTWDEVYEWHEKITRFDSAGNVEILGFDPMDAMAGAGGPDYFWMPDFGLPWWDKENFTITFDDPRFVGALATIKRFYDLVGVEKIAGFRTSFGTWTQSPTSSFPAGVQAMIINGAWQPGELAHSAPDKHFRYTWPPVPSERKGVKWQASGGHWGNIPLRAKHPEAAFKFIEFLTTDEVADLIFELTGWFSPKISWNTKVDVSRYEGLEFYTKSILEADEMWGMAVCPVTGFVGQQWYLATDTVLYGKKTPEQAAKDMEKACRDELRKQFPDLASG
jgi:multiple sugar transport system substrate-binding protein